MEDIWEKTDSSLRRKNIPISIVFELTRRCNLSCIHCYNTKDDVQLTMRQIENIALGLRRAGCLFLTLTGGEIFVRDDCLEIVSLLRHMGFDIKIITNGTMITNIEARRLKELSVSEIGVSLYGVSSSVHDRITQVKGSFEKTLSAIKALKKEGIAVHIKCTIMKENFAEYRGIIELSRNLEVTYIIDPVISPKDDGSNSVLRHRLDFEDLKSFYWEEFDSINTEDSSQRGANFCDAGFNFGAISAEGNVYPCIQLPLKVGNVFENDFKDIWDNSPLLNDIRRRVNSGESECTNCNLYHYCSRCPGLSYLENGSLFGPSESACLTARIYKEFRDRKRYEVKN